MQTIKGKIALIALCVTATVLLSIACRPAAKKANTTTPPLDETAYKAEMEKWQSTRLANLTKEDGWLTLIGLYWLNEGENKFGSDTHDTVVLPKDKAPAVAGTFTLKDGHVQIAVRDGVQVTADGKPVTTLDLKDDNDDSGPTIVRLGSLIINIVKRGDRLGVRVKDSESKTRREFKGLEYYPIDPKWRIEARFEQIGRAHV